MLRESPGLCPICDAPHCGCSPGGADSVVILGQRDAMVAAQTVSIDTPVAAATVEPAPPTPDPFTPATYDRKKHGLKRPTR
jgi:hypothetical protein